MRTQDLVSIGLFTMAAVITIYAWSDRIAGRNAAINEAFEVKMNPETQSAMADMLVTSAPTDDEAVTAHKTLLRYIQADWKKGILFVMDFGKRFYGNNLSLRDDLDSRHLMDNYRSPLQG
jgi:hypothetical protein